MREKEKNMAAKSWADSDNSDDESFSKSVHIRTDSDDEFFEEQKKILEKATWYANEATNEIITSTTVYGTEASAVSRGSRGSRAHRAYRDHRYHRTSKANDVTNTTETKEVNDTTETKRITNTNETEEVIKAINTIDATVIPRTRRATKTTSGANPLPICSCCLKFTANEVNRNFYKVWKGLHDKQKWDEEKQTYTRFLCCGGCSDSNGKTHGPTCSMKLFN